MARARRKVLVTSLDEISSGVLLAVEPCGLCNSSHEAMALRRGTCRPSSEPSLRVECWTLMPYQWPCQGPDDKRVAVVSERTVAAKRCYRIVDDGPDEYVRTKKTVRAGSL